MKKSKQESKGTKHLLLGAVLVGVVVLMVLQNVRLAQIKNRDSTRKLVVSQVQNGLEQYYQKHHEYPLTIDLPKDPVAQLSYFYEVSFDHKKYKLFARLENIKDEDNALGLDADCGVPCTYVKESQ